MLRHLSIEHYALIDHLEIDLEKGLNILTGETGSGKSIILGALGLILGGRADISSVKKGTKKCIIEGGFNLPAQPFKAFFEKSDLDFEETTLIRREILSTGKSRAFVNDTPVKLNMLKELGLQLVDIHSQHQTIQINDRNFQLELIDAFANTDAERMEYKTRYSEYTNLKNQLQEAEESRQKSLSEDDYKKFQLKELESINLDELDSEALEEEYNTLAHAEEIGQSLSRTSDILSEGEGAVVPALREAQSALEAIGDYGKNYRELAERINSSLIELDDIATEIENSLGNVEADPRRLSELEETKSGLFRLEQKHLLSGVEALIEKREELKADLASTGSLDEKIEAYKEQLKDAEIALQKQGEEFSKKRRASFKPFTARVIKVLQSLNMKSARFQINHEKQESPTPSGFDSVSMLFTANAGQDPQPLKKVASGGELSRLMLAVKMLSADKSFRNTIVFDEIDSGVSGEVAHSMGDILKQMAGGTQVICITHLPQIASKGSAHFKVFKTEKESAETRIERLDGNDRITEIAQMLSGANTTDAALANAQELLQAN